jgi:hypothetical protein
MVNRALSCDPQNYGPVRAIDGVLFDEHQRDFRAGTCGDVQPDGIFAEFGVMATRLIQFLTK